MRVHALPGLVALLACSGGRLESAAAAVDFKAELFGQPQRIFANVVAQDPDTGYVQINGGAEGLTNQPPLWDFGDGTVAASWFPAEHTYVPPRSNYIVKVTGYFTDGDTNSTEVLVRFAPPGIKPVALPEALRVTIPTNAVSLVSRMPGYGFSSSLTHFDDSFFTTNLPRSVVEHVLTVAAVVQNDLLNSNVFLVDGAFQQWVLRDPTAGGMYSIWYSSPVAFGSGDYGFGGTPQYSSFFHEMGHNFTLNFPAGCWYGGKIDGNANAIYSETLAQIFQHAAAYEILNRAADYSLSPDVVFEIHQSARDSIRLVRATYDHYLGSGMNFFSWNDPATPEDETFDTFMTIAYKFFAHAETAGQGYRKPVQRMMRLLAVFNDDLRQQYDQHHDTPVADQFRATLLVTALSYAFQSDLRAEFRDLHFPVSDEVYEQLMSLAPYDSPSLSLLHTATNTVVVSWPLAGTHGWVLQATNALPSVAAPWPIIPPPYQTNGANLQFIESATTRSKFYRLHNP